MTQREASVAEKSELATLGRMSETIRMSAMGRLVGTSARCFLPPCRGSPGSCCRSSRGSPHPLPLLSSAAFGLLIAAIFTPPPLACAPTQPAAAISAPSSTAAACALADDRSRLLAAGALVTLAPVTADEPVFAAAVLGASGAVLLLLLTLGWVIGVAARRVPRPCRPLLRLAMANLHRPGAQTIAVLVALGLALTLFVTLAGIQTSLDAGIRRVVPQREPDLFAL